MAELTPDVEIPLKELTIAQMEQLILDGADPTELAEATAAGGSIVIGEDGGHTIVQVDYAKPEVTPESGFDTTGIAVQFEEGVKHVADALELQNEQAVPDTVIYDTIETQEPEEVETLPVSEEVDDDPEEVDPETPDDEPETPVEDPEVPEDDEPEDDEEEPIENPLEDEDPIPGIPNGPQGNNGWGNGDDDAPGGSENHNNAENAGGNRDGMGEAPGNSGHLDQPQQHVDVS